MAEYLMPDYEPRRRDEIYTHGNVDHIVDMWRQDADAQKEWKFRRNVNIWTCDAFKLGIGTGSGIVALQAMEAFSHNKVGEGVIGGIVFVAAAATIPLIGAWEKRVDNLCERQINLFKDPTEKKEHTRSRKTL